VLDFAIANNVDKSFPQTDETKAGFSKTRSDIGLLLEVIPAAKKLVSVAFMDVAKQTLAASTGWLNKRTERGEM
jgi:hypothetical protein